ncbi:GlxA family transcriptional regulator [Paeniglutamicibacter psychrophenolicus]|uniref:GlxA family transcriptional regulator n=1 Tax=Paeniglutamicibacter psychrophenolicus TaxID=257454 RepID=UPI00278B6DC0|nr:helix-turn-helix domain-containing protein [Paeniglutamicibacter psychrophenolicus]MDQ0095030.1 transcriptional regulator GlxA family with amidase domain [Paeniglutamicibacter psychrophenolicus]
MHRVVALALPDVVAFDLAIPAQVFGHVDERQLYSFAVCAAEPGLVQTTTGYAIHAAEGLEALRSADTIVVPGFSPLTDPPPEVSKALRGAAANGTRLVSVCTGAFALAAAGLLDGKRATTHWRNAERLQTLHPEISVDAGVLYIDEGGVTTSAGVAAGIDLCLHLVRTDHGTEAANRIARRMVVAPHREGGQAQFIERPVAPPLAHFAETCGWAIQHLAEPLTVVGMASHAGWGPSSFARKFLTVAGTTPLRWLTSQRITEACRLLETTNLTVEAIAARTGLGTSANFRLHFTRELNTTPSNYRRLYQGRNRPAMTPRSPEGEIHAQPR